METISALPAFPTPTGGGSKGMTIFEYVTTHTFAALIIAKPNLDKNVLASEAIEYAQAFWTKVRQAEAS